ncbi:uncharacterized protein LOC143032345 isoform X2 [Oratosquilla oratoria]
MLGDIDGEMWAWNLGSAPSEDIWKKFELIPTPPRSPLRDTDYSEISDLLDAELPLLEGDINTDDLLALCSDDERSSPEEACNHGFVGSSLVGCHKCAQLVHAGTEVRHDCMWAGHCPSDTHKVASRNHNDSCSHITDLLDSSSSSALGSVAGFTHLADLHTEDEDDDDDSQIGEDLTLESIRPDTPSESSDTDTECEDNIVYEDDDDDIDDVRQLGVSREEEVYTSNTVSVVHIDHSYHCPRIPTSLPTTTAPTHPQLGIQTPSDSEDEIDVVSVGSPDSAYSSASSFSTSSSRNVNNSNNNSNSSSSSSSSSSNSTRGNSKRNGHRHSSKSGVRKHKEKQQQQQQQQQQHDLKSVKLATNNLPSNPSRKVRKHLQQTMAAGVRRRNGTAASSTVDASGTTILIKRGGNSKTRGTKRILEGQGNSRGSKRSALRSDSDDPERRHLHNSLERLRRIDLRNAFEELRALVPDLAEKDKAAKVVILKKAADYCQMIRRQEQVLVQERSRQLRHQSELKKRFDELQRQYR